MWHRLVIDIRPVNKFPAFIVQCFPNFFLVYHCHNTKNVCVPLGTANINAPFRILVLKEVSLVGMYEVFIPANQENNNTAETLNFPVATFLI
jgi:hypothetical protein